ncbi:galactose oxidase [Rhypophila decipiens]
MQTFIHVLLPFLTLLPFWAIATKPIHCQTNNAAGGKWTSDLPPIAKFPRQEHITLFIPPSNILIIGGIIPSPNSDPTNPWPTTDLVQLYDTATPGGSNWTELPHLPIPLNHGNAAYVKGKIYVLLGLEVTADGSWRGTPRSWVLDFEKWRICSSGKKHKVCAAAKPPVLWEELPTLPKDLVARGSAAVGVYGDKIYLAGGMTVLQPWQGGMQDSVGSVVVFDTHRKRWLTEVNKKVDDLPAPRDHAGVAVVEGIMYVLGGRDHGQVNVRDTVFALDIRSEKAASKGWTIKKGRMPTARGGIAAAAVGKRIFTFGGEGNSEPGANGVFNQTEAYDVGTDSWQRLGPMRLPRHGTYAAAVGGRIYIPGGGVQTSAGPVDVVDAFEPCIGSK